MELKTINTLQNISHFSETGLLTGYASVFNNIDQHNDIILKGAFEGVDANRVKFLWQHDSKVPIGSVLSLAEDNFGLKVEIALNLNVRKAKEAFSLVKSNAISGLSIGFNPLDYDYDKDGIRVLKKINLWEISLVTFPSNCLANVVSTKTNISTLEKLTDTINKANNALEKLIK